MKTIFLLLSVFFAAPTFAAMSSPPTSEVTSIMVVPDSVTMPVGTLIQLYGHATPVASEATWTSSNPGVARLDQGAPKLSQFVTGVAQGTATITATVNGHSSSCAVTVGPVGTPLSTTPLKRK